MTMQIDKIIFDFIGTQYNINLIELTLFIVAGGLFHFSVWYYIVTVFMAVGSMIYRNYPSPIYNEKNKD